MKIVDVAVGVIKRHDMIYISKRADTLHQGGLWEFPGGKKEADETIAQTLSRELLEEVNIQVLKQTPLMVIEHDYGDKKVRLDVRLVEQFSGEPSPQENQLGRWVKLEELSQYDFPQANIAIIDKLLQIRA
ncbi:8-oxo-dGTP diphosphatase MutT [Paraglaciecola sp.]|uniref:8-oxo-dGTP diphosphatase MutT n=1 Tax=Paraglaciecola sp. TaxID=1920173 RepID=UPI0030F445E7